MRQVSCHLPANCGNSLANYCRYDRVYSGDLREIRCRHSVDCCRSKGLLRQKYEIESRNAPSTSGNPCASILALRRSSKLGGDGVRAIMPRYGATTACRGNTHNRRGEGWMASVGAHHSPASFHPPLYRPSNPSRGVGGIARSRDVGAISAQSPAVALLRCHQRRSQDAAE